MTQLWLYQSFDLNTLPGHASSILQVHRYEHFVDQGSGGALVRGFGLVMVGHLQDCRDRLLLYIVWRHYDIPGSIYVQNHAFARIH